MSSLQHSGLTPAVLAYSAPDPPVAEFEPPRDRAFYADPKKSSLLSAASHVRHLTPYIGTELSGIQLSHLTDTQKDELALLAAERGVVFFRDQDLTIDQQYDLTKHYGLQDRDANQVDPRHVTIIGRDNDGRDFANYGAEYHSDHSYEANPPSYTMLRVVRTPDSGGDTIWTSQTALFDKLSPSFQGLFEHLHAVHSSEQGYINTINGGSKPFRGPVRREHPLVRTHPVTNQKSLFYNPTFVIHLSELKGQEAAHVLSFLREHVHTADDLTVRWQWRPHSVAFWDNRIVTHRAVPGGYNVSEREGKRTAVFGERPFYDPKGRTLSEHGSLQNGTQAKVNGASETNGAPKNIY